MIGTRLFASLSALATVVLTTAARAQDEVLSPLPTIGKPTPGGMGFQPFVTEVGRDIQFLDTFLLVVITVISLFVTALLVWVAIRYNAKRNPEPARFTHNTTIEIAWTLIPVLILIVIGSLSLPVLFKQMNVPEPDLTVKVTGFQWAWAYEYPDHGIFYESYMLAENQLEEFGYAPDEYLLATDTSVVVPVDAVVKLQITASDVIHSWAIPSFGVKMDAVPGRLNETWFKAEQVGVYFGQCSELCGINHAYMPITVKVVPQEEFDLWIAAAQELYAQGEPVTGAFQVAAAN
ncbi:MAG: cytochrome c oxidase subunit II [Pseudomonadota bacterium]